jgi:hypothetical protein
VYDDTCCHHLPHLLNAPGSIRVPNNFPTWLQHAKCMFYILSSNLLLFCEPLHFSQRWPGKGRCHHLDNNPCHKNDNWSHRKSGEHCHLQV